MSQFKDEKHAFEVYAAKGPVWYPTSQIKAHQAFQLFKDKLTHEETCQLWTAVSHAIFVGEGRGEFDALCKKIKERLWPNSSS